MANEVQCVDEFDRREHSATFLKNNRKLLLIVGSVSTFALIWLLTSTLPVSESTDKPIIYLKGAGRDRSFDVCYISRTSSHPRKLKISEKLLRT